MSCPICKRRQISMLENVVAIDRILFNKSNPKQCLTETNNKQYNKIKNAMLINLYEIYKEFNYISENVYKDGIKQINRASLEKGEIVLSETVELFKQKPFLQELNEEIQNTLSQDKSLDFKRASNKVVLKSIMEVSLDRLMLENALEGLDESILENTKVNLLLKAHKSFRNDLVTLAINEDVLNKL